MRVLLDQSTPVPIRPFLKGHIVSTAAREGWDRLENGDLLNVAEAAGSDVLVTADKNMRYQQNLARTASTRAVGCRRGQCGYSRQLL